MYQSLFIGNKVVKLEEVDSTNTYLQKCITIDDKVFEGLVVIAQNQIFGKGQRGNEWKSNSGENLTFSVLLKPNLLVQDQFLISKLVSLAIIDLLKEIGISNSAIKWPNDIYCDDNKIAGILIENTIRSNKVYHSIVGIGLNVNQLSFGEGVKNPTSVRKELNLEFDLDSLLSKLLFFLEKRYLLLKASKIELIDTDYLKNLYGLSISRSYMVNDELVKGEVVGVSKIGKLQLKRENKIEEFDLKEITFLF